MTAQILHYKQDVHQDLVLQNSGIQPLVNKQLASHAPPPE